jgi:Helix-turn-helix domain of transposase family ISL3
MTGLVWAGYTLEFKQEAVRLVRGGQTVSSVAKTLGLSDQRLLNWLKAEAAPVKILPPPSPRTSWTRKGVAGWLVERLAEDVATLVGIDHGFSFPLRYFEAHRLEPDWPGFLDEFQRHLTKTTPTILSATAQ